MTRRPTAPDLAELVRLPAALSVPGDAWAGAVWGGRSATRSSVMPVASVLLYWSGMALNDWADREVDALERPERTIPSGRVTPQAALTVAGVLGAAGVAASAAAGGRPALRVSIPLAMLIAAYDVLAKDSPAGPLVMAATRGLDVLLGAGAAPGAAVAPAAAVAVHTAGVTVLSRGEVHGTTPAVALAALTATASAVAVLGVRASRDDVPARDRWAALALAGLYGVAVGAPQARALQAPDARRAREATGAGIRGLTLLQASWLAAGGQLGRAAAVACAGPVLRRAARAVSPT